MFVVLLLCYRYRTHLNMIQIFENLRNILLMFTALVDSSSIYRSLEYRKQISHQLN